MNQVAPSTRKLMKMALSALEKNQAQQALNCLEQVLALNPHHVEALHKYGFIMHSAGRYDMASDFYQRAIAADPAHVESYLLLSSLLEAQNRGVEALQLALHAATQVAPENAHTHAAVVSAMLRQQQSHMAVPYMESVLPRFPENGELHEFYCMALKVNDRLEEARAAYKHLRSKWRVPLAFRIMFETYLPRQSRSNDEIDAVRAEFRASVEQFIQEKGRLEVGMLSASSLFFLAFHNRDNKELLQLYTRMLRTIAPELNYVAAHSKVSDATAGQRKRIAFVSAHMHKHSVGNCYRGAVIHLSQQPEFEVCLFNIANVFDEKMQEMADAGIPIISLPKNITAAYKAIEGFKPDLVIYPDIGMHAMAHYLAMGRLARYQACFQGHPETTGIDTVDYVISSRSYEPPHAEENYTERLLCNEGIDTVFKRPSEPQRWLTREELQLPADKKLYVCPMAIQKFHPDFDEALASILAHDPAALLVLFNDFDQQAATDILRARILAKCDPARVIFLPWQPLDHLFSIMKEADVILDTFYFGAGTTSQYAFHFGFPIVTMPGRYARGRVVHSYYHIMGIDQPPEASTPEAYVQLAVKLANDREYKEALSKEILAKNQRMFEQGEYGPHLVQLVHDIFSQDLEKYRR